MGSAIVFGLVLVAGLIFWLLLRGGSGKRSRRPIARPTDETGAPASAADDDRTPPPNARPLFEIRYREDFGPVVRRDIFPIRPYATPEGVRAWCYLMGEMRLFKFAQIEGVKDIRAGRDIMARGLWKWCGLPDMDVAFADEAPDAIKQSHWPQTPSGAVFALEIAQKDGATYRIEVSPARWGSHRRAFVGHCWPGQESVEIDWVDVVRAIDLETGEIMDRCGFWRAVLHHRDVGELPWYVQWADQRPAAEALVLFARAEFGQFRSKDREAVSLAMEELKLAPIDDDGMGALVRAAGKDQLRPLTTMERAACRDAARRICEGRGKDPAAGIAERFPV